MRLRSPIFLVIALLLGCLAAQGQVGHAPVEKVDTIPIAKIPDIAPKSPEEFQRAFRKAVDFLLANQNEDGSWGTHTKTKGLNVICPPPTGPLSFRSASTALCLLGLYGSPLRDEPAVKESCRRGEDYLLEALPKLKRGETMTILNAWAHGYGLEALCKGAERLPKDSKRYAELEQCAALQIKRLDELTDARGGWGYYTFKVFSVRPIGMPTSFMTAAVLIAMKDTERVFGIKPDQRQLRRTVKFLVSQRTPSGNYVYSSDHTYHPTLPINRHMGSLARTPAGDLALLWYAPDVVTMRQLEDGLDRLWSRSGWLDLAAKKPIPHESFAQVAGYFVFYGYYYAGRCLAVLPKDKVKRHAAHLASQMMLFQEKDGSWWDYPLYNYHKFYGTGYALSALDAAWDVLYGDSVAHGDSNGAKK
ncbi:MAG: prenyltransferase/squalene oxidase repeat-containing protein [Akkermansia sp.]